MAAPISRNGLISREDLPPRASAHMYLRNGILSGVIPVGARLRSEEIAQQLNMSRMPVRDALRQLESEGLVTIRPNRGAIVTNLSLTDIEELFEIRGALEGLAASITAQRATQEEIDELERRILDLEKMKSDLPKWLEWHDALHDRLCQLSGRRELNEQIQKIRQRVRPYIMLYSSGHDDPELVGYEHRLFIKPLRERDAESARSRVEAHIVANGRSIIAAIAQAQISGQSGQKL